MSDAETAGLYLRDLGFLLRDMAFDVRRKWDAIARESDHEADKAFVSGQLMAFHTVISLMQGQAELFGIPLEDLSLDSVVPERDLLAFKPQ